MPSDGLLGLNSNRLDCCSALHWGIKSGEDVPGDVRDQWEWPGKR